MHSTRLKVPRPIKYWDLRKQTTSFSTGAARATARPGLYSTRPKYYCGRLSIPATHPPTHLQRGSHAPHPPIQALGTFSGSSVDPFHFVRDLIEIHASFQPPRHTSPTRDTLTLLGAKDAILGRFPLQPPCLHFHLHLAFAYLSDGQ